jgi:hypothetical protein
MNYTIVPSSGVLGLIRYAVQDDVSHLRYSLDGESCVLKYHDEQSGYFSSFVEYTSSQIKTIMQNADWNRTEAPQFCTIYPDIDYSVKNSSDKNKVEYTKIFLDRFTKVTSIEVFPLTTKNSDIILGIYNQEDVSLNDSEPYKLVAQTPVTDVSTMSSNSRNKVDLLFDFTTFTGGYYWIAFCQNNKKSKWAGSISSYGKSDLVYFEEMPSFGLPQTATPVYENESSIYVGANLGG